MIFPYDFNMKRYISRNNLTFNVKELSDVYLYKGEKIATDKNY